MADKVPERKQGFWRKVFTLLNLSDPELERRVADLEKKSGDEEQARFAVIEKRISDLAHNLPDRHLRVFAIVFASLSGLIAFSAIFVGWLAWGLKSDAQQRIQEARTEAQQAIRETKADSLQATKDMQLLVQQAVSNMNYQFQVLAGESLKKPDLKILVESGQPLQGQEFVISNGQPIPSLDTLFFTNAGTKATGPINLHLDCSQGATIGTTWLPVQTQDKEFPRRFESLSWNGVSIEPGNDRAFPNPHCYLNFDQAGVTNATFRLVVFYGDDRRTEAVFYLKRKD